MRCWKTFRMRHEDALDRVLQQKRYNNVSGVVPLPPILAAMMCDHQTTWASSCSQKAVLAGFKTFLLNVSQFNPTHPLVQAIRPRLATKKQPEHSTTSRRDTDDDESVSSSSQQNSQSIFKTQTGSKRTFADAFHAIIDKMSADSINADCAAVQNCMAQFANFSKGRDEEMLQLLQEQPATQWQIL